MHPAGVGFIQVCVGSLEHYLGSSSSFGFGFINLGVPSGRRGDWGSRGSIWAHLEVVCFTHVRLGSLGHVQGSMSLSVLAWVH